MVQFSSLFMLALVGKTFKEHIQLTLTLTNFHHNLLSFRLNISKLRLCWLRNFISCLSLQSFSSISGQPWIHHYIQARRHLQLQTSGKLSSPLLPNKNDDGLSQEPVTSSQTTKLLREVLQSDAVRSHSLKHTCLSFAAKNGLDPHVRKLLGYHLDRHEVTLATCSRDLLAESLRQLKTLLTEIQSGIFIPDSTRSGYLPEQTSLPSLPPTTIEEPLDLPQHSENLSEDNDKDQYIDENLFDLDSRLLILIIIRFFIYIS